MSTTAKYIVEKIRTVELDTCDSLKKIQSTIQLLASIVENKLEKLSNVITACDVAVVEDRLLIRDGLGVVKNLQGILVDYGFVVDVVEEDTYLVGEELMEFIVYLQSSITLESIVGKIFSTDRKLQKKHSNMNAKITRFTGLDELRSERVLADIIAKVLSGESIEVDEIDTVEETYYDDKFRGSERVCSTNKLTEYDMALSKLKKALIAQQQKASRDVMKGTTTVLKTRAEQMGYTVTTVKTKDRVELVLVRSV